MYYTRLATMRRIEVLGFARKHVGMLKLAGALSASLHSSSTRNKSTGSDLAQEISDNILAAGIRYLKEDKERVAENLRRRKAGVVLENMVRLKPPLPCSRNGTA